MTKLSHTQAVILSAAAQPDDGAVLPLPDTLKIKGGAVDKVLRSLKAKGLIEHQGIPRGDDPPPLRITRAGLQAIGVETEGDAPEGATPPDTGATPAECRSRGYRRPGPGDRGRQCRHTGEEQDQGEAGQAEHRRHPRASQRLVPAPNRRQMIELLKRPEGATVEQIAEVTGWQKHTIRGAISGALKKKLGLTIETTRTREVGPNKTGAKGSSTVYRITGSSPSTE